MYSYDDRLKAVKLYEQYDCSAAATIGELSYPSRKVLNVAEECKTRALKVDGGGPIEPTFLEGTQK